MPKGIEFFPPVKKAPEAKPEGTVSEEDGIKIWKADEAEFAASSGSAESGKAREYIVPKKEKSADEIIKKTEEMGEQILPSLGGQQSPNIELSRGNYFDGSIPRDTHPRQKDLKMERKWTRDKTKNMKLVQPLAPEDDMDIAV